MDQPQEDHKPNDAQEAASESDPGEEVSGTAEADGKVSASDCDAQAGDEGDGMHRILESLDRGTPSVDEERGPAGPTREAAFDGGTDSETLATEAMRALDALLDELEKEEQGDPSPAEE